MTIEHHDLAHELPEFKELIHTLKIESAHFKRLFDEYHELTKHVEAMESETVAVATVTEEEAKKRRLFLKDELFAMLKKSA